MISVADAKARLGIATGNTAQDAVISAVFAAALSIAEAYCRRRFILKNEMEVFHHFGGRALPLARYPIHTVESVQTGTGSTVVFEVARGLGQLEFGGMVRADRLTVKYAGGYDGTNFPADLELALWTIFDYLWAQTPGGGVAAGSVAGAGAMKSFSIPGVLSIDYGNASASAGAGAGAGAGGAHIPPLAVSILDLYRREQA
jgi:hypothetical protein